MPYQPATPVFLDPANDARLSTPQEEGNSPAVPLTKQARFETPLTPREQLLLCRGIIGPADFAGIGMPISRESIRPRYPARRELQHLTGDLYPEASAREILKRVSEHQWLEAEKAGRDIWAERDPQCPRRAAVRDWFRRFFLRWRTSARFPTFYRHA
jgi:hypothetical protein